MICDYGCGKEASYQLKNGKRCCCKYTSQCEEMRKRNTIGLKQAHKDGKMNTRHLKCYRNSNKGKKFGFKYDLKEYLNGKFILSNKLKIRLIEEEIKEHKCEKCNLTQWNDKDIPLELHHKDGNKNNNSLENLQLLCPNCHAQTDFYRGKNKLGWKQKNQIISDEDFIKSLKNNKSIRQALIELGLEPKGGNYIRAKKLLSSISPNR